MESKTAVNRLSALAQDTRLAIYRLLVQSGPDGMCVGDIATRLLTPAPTLSFHLKELSHADLVHSRQEGRFIFYAPNFDVMNELLGYLTENCCGGAPCEVACAPVKAPRKRKAS